jgi:hypothetical protein
MADWTGSKEYEADVRGYFPCCPLCGSKKIDVHLIPGGRDTLSCGKCGAKWHIYVGLMGLKWAELDVEADDGIGKELLGRRLDKNEWRKMAHQTRRQALKTSTSKDEEVRTQSTAAREKEIIREKEVIVKVRCPYCHKLYDETLDKCPHCGGHM